VKIAIIGAGLSGLACALECERLGVIPHVFEKEDALGWPYVTVSYWPELIYRTYGDVFEYLKKTYDIILKPAAKVTKNILKSPNKEVIVNGNLGYYIYRGRKSDSLENQLYRYLKSTAVFMNTPVEYKELAKKYDWVVIASGREKEARELGVWEDMGSTRIVGTFFAGEFEPNSATLYVNTEYAGTGFARLSPYSKSMAITGMYIFGKDDINCKTLSDRFLEIEGLDKYEILYHFLIPPFSRGRVTKFRIGNILLTGRSAGLVDRLFGTGGIEAITSGIMAARAIIQNKDYDKMVKPLQKHIENVSSLRSIIKEFSNEDFDKLLSYLDNNWVKKTTVNVPVDIFNMFGKLLKTIFICER
jgi:digeranylgeranylglycerophospholipid reductase